MYVAHILIYSFQTKNFQRMDAIISNKQYSLISTPEVELSDDSSAMKIKSDVSERNDVPAGVIGPYSKSEVLPEGSVISSTTKDTLVPSSLGQSVVSEPSGNVCTTYKNLNF